MDSQLCHVVARSVSTTLAIDLNGIRRRPSNFPATQKRQSRTSDVARGRCDLASHSIHALLASHIPGRLPPNITSSTKPEVHNVLHCRQRKTETRPRTENFAKLPANRHTDRHTEKGIAKLRTSLARGRNKNAEWRNKCPRQENMARQTHTRLRQICQYVDMQRGLV